MLRKHFTSPSQFEGEKTQKLCVTPIVLNISNPIVLLMLELIDLMTQELIRFPL